MEFFAIAKINTTAEELQKLTVQQLSHYCEDIDKILHVENDNNADIYCLWGEFNVQRQLINGGIRFTLPTCPNAFAWTITSGYPPAAEHVVIHGTINRTEHDEDFIESIEMFMESWKQGLENNWAKHPPNRRQPTRVAVGEDGLIAAP